MLGGKGGTGGIQIFGVDVRRDALHRGQRRFQRALGGLGGLALQPTLQLVDLLAVKMPSPISRIRILAMGSRRASASRSAAER